MRKEAERKADGQYRHPVEVVRERIVWQVDAIRSGHKKVVNVRR